MVPQRRENIVGIALRCGDRRDNGAADLDPHVGHSPTCTGRFPTTSSGERLELAQLMGLI